MRADRGRILAPSGAAVALATLVAGCAAPAGEDGRSVVRVTPPRPQAVEVRLAHPQVQGLTPSLLVPPPNDDVVIATVGDIEIHKSQVFDRILESDRRFARVWVDLLVLDAVIAEFATRYEITVSVELVDQLAKEEEQALRSQVEIESGGRTSFEDVLARQFGVDLEEYRATVRTEVARVQFRGLVIRYVGMLEERVEVRFIVHADRSELEAARAKVLDGADFASLAKRLSQDETRRQGGLLPPFSRTFQHPIAKQAFELERGEVSEVFAIADSGPPRFALVYCVQRLEGHPRPFAEVREQLAADLERRRVTEFEQTAFAVEYCQASGALPSDESGR